jgi:hypothetical protein
LRALGCAVASWIWLAGGAAQAYCRTSSCSDCPRAEATGCTIGGSPVAWPNACVSFSMNSAASAKVDLERATALMAEAFATWEAVRCSGDAGPSIKVSHSFGAAVCAEPQYNPQGANANVIVFRDESWPHTGTGHQLASTSLTVGTDGTIYDADMEINATGPLSISEPQEAGEIGVAGFIPGAHDLPSIMLHEAGHFLGLDHSREEGAVMRAELDEAAVRTQLSADDVAAICAVYPPDRAADSCNDRPRGGFSSKCVEAGGCSLRPGARASGLQLALSLGLLCLWRVARAARRTRR